MKQVSIEKYFDTQSVGLFSYAFSVHVNSREDLEPIYLYLRQRFDVWHLAFPEVSPNGNLHIQGYGETAVEFSKNERKMFQPKGRYYKHLNTEIKKPFGCATARRSRYYNVMYCLKNAVDLDWLCTEVDIELRQQMMDESKIYQGEIKKTERRTQQSQSYESRVSRWYLDKPVGDRPQTVTALSRLIIEENMCPWQHCTPEAILKLTRYVLITYGNTSTRARETERLLSRIEELDSRT